MEELFDRSLDVLCTVGCEESAVRNDDLCGALRGCLGGFAWFCSRPDDERWDCEVLCVETRQFVRLEAAVGRLSRLVDRVRTWLPRCVNEVPSVP